MRTLGAVLVGLARFVLIMMALPFLLVAVLAAWGGNDRLMYWCADHLIEKDAHAD